jgi:hypothetical protein
MCTTFGDLLVGRTTIIACALSATGVIVTLVVIAGIGALEFNVGSTPLLASFEIICIVLLIRILLCSRPAYGTVRRSTEALNYTAIFLVRSACTVHRLGAVRLRVEGIIGVHSRVSIVGRSRARCDRLCAGTWCLVCGLRRKSVIGRYKVVKDCIRRGQEVSERVFVGNDLLRNAISVRGDKSRTGTSQKM